MYCKIYCFYMHCNCLIYKLSFKTSYSLFYFLSSTLTFLSITILNHSIDHLIEIKDYVLFTLLIYLDFRLKNFLSKCFVS